MPEVYLRKIEFRYSACGSFTENKKIIKIFKKLEIQEIFTKTN